LNDVNSGLVDQTSAMYNAKAALNIK